MHLYLFTDTYTYLQERLGTAYLRGIVGIVARYSLYLSVSKDGYKPLFHRHSGTFITRNLFKKEFQVI